MQQAFNRTQGGQKVKVICAWCKMVIKDGPDTKISHGICHDCFAVECRKVGEKICKKSSDFVTDSDCRYCHESCADALGGLI